MYALLTEFDVRRRVLSLSAAALTAVPVLTATASAASGSPAAVARPAVRYEITDLGTLGGTFSAASDVNERGTVTGLSTSKGDTALRGFIWQRGVLTDIGTLGGPQSAAAAINASGQVAGWSDTNIPAHPSLFNTTSLFCNPPMQPHERAVACRAIRWDRGKLTDLGTLGGLNSTAGNRGLNNRGQVVGTAETKDVDPTGTHRSRKFHAFVWGPSPNSGRRAMIDLGTLSGDPDSFANSINDRGQVAGVSIGNSGSPTEEGSRTRAVLWSAGRITALPTLGGSFSVANMINNRGQIVGVASLPGDTTRHAVLWRGGKVIDLGTLRGDVFSEANNITDRGQIVGLSCSTTGCHAAVWDGVTPSDLNTLLPTQAAWQLGDAAASNTHGLFAGGGHHDLLSHAYLLAPTTRNASRGS